METEEVQDIIVEEITYEFPRLTVETVCDIADVVGQGWDWEEELIPSMKKYIKNGIGIYSKQEFIDCDDELYDDSDKDMDIFIENLQSKYCCVCWQAEQYKESEDNCDIDETETIYVWCD